MCQKKAEEIIGENVRKETGEQAAAKHGLISVIIPTYNRMGTLERSVQSVLAQTYTHFELLIIDDASTDATEQYIKGIADERIRYYRNESNIGPAASRNRGVSLALGEYLAFQDSDDEWMPDKLQKLMQMLADTDEKTGMVYHEMMEARGGEDVIPPRTIPSENKEGNLYSYMLLYPLIGVPATLIKKSCFEACGGFDAKMQCFEDYEFFLRVAKQYEILFWQEPLILIHDTPGSVNKRYREKIDTELFVLETHFDALCQYGILREKVNLVRLQAENYDEEAYFYKKITELAEKMQTEDRTDGVERASLLLESTSWAAHMGKERGVGDRSAYYQNAAEQLSHVAQSLSRLAGNIKKDGTVLAKNREAVRRALVETAENVAGYVDLVPAPAKEKDILAGIRYRLESWESDAKSYDALLELEKEVRRLLEQMGQLQHYCTVCGSRVRFLPFSPYNKVMREHYGYRGKNTFLFEEGAGDCCPVCGASQRVRFLFGFLADICPEENEKLRICYRGTENGQDGGMKEFIEAYVASQPYLTGAVAAEEGKKADVIICTGIWEKGKDTQMLLETFFRELAVNGIVVILPLALAAVDNTGDEGNIKIESERRKECREKKIPEEKWRSCGLEEVEQIWSYKELQTLSKQVGFELQSVDVKWFGKEFYEQYAFGNEAKLFFLTKRSES